MMTPWYLFKKMETKASVDGAAVINSEGEGATYLIMTEHARIFVTQCMIAC